MKKLTKAQQDAAFRKIVSTKIEAMGSDDKVADILKNMIGTRAPNRSTIGRIRRGEGKIAYVAMVYFMLGEASRREHDWQSTEGYYL
jgi:hypothetical protein